MSIILQPKTNVIILIGIAVVILFLAACSPPAEKLNQQGNQAFTEQEYLEALELYQSAQIESPELGEPYFNAANTLYRQGDYPAALEQMQMALQYVDEETLVESSFYNMGNTLFNTQDLSTAVEAYKQALLLNPEDQDAKYNLELALQQQEQQQQDDNQDQGEEETEPDSEENSDSQDQEGEDGESESSENQEQNSDQSENNDQSNSDHKGDQEDESGQPQEGENPQESQQPSQTPAPGQRMTEEQARQLLAAIANDMQTLQERLGEYLFARQAPPAQDW